MGWEPVPEDLVLAETAAAEARGRYREGDVPWGIVEAADAGGVRVLTTYLRDNDWPREDREGEEACRAAWNLAQHATDQPAFMRDCLAWMWKQADSVPAWHIAYLSDRLAFMDGRPQEYGTQFSYEDGRAVPRPLAPGADAMRAAVGLEPLAEAYPEWYRCQEARGEARGED